MQEDVKQWLRRLQCEVCSAIMCYCVSVLLYLPAITCNWLIQLQEFIRNFEEHGYTRFDFIWGMTIEVSVWDWLE